MVGRGALRTAARGTQAADHRPILRHFERARAILGRLAGPNAAQRRSDRGRSPCRWLLTAKVIATAFPFTVRNLRQVVRRSLAEFESCVRAEARRSVPLRHRNPLGHARCSAVEVPETIAMNEALSVAPYLAVLGASIAFVLNARP